MFNVSHNAHHPRPLAGSLGFAPQFVEALDNVTVTEGREAIFTCVVDHLGGYRVGGPPRWLQGRWTT